MKKIRLNDLPTDLLLTTLTFLNDIDRMYFLLNVPSEVICLTRLCSILTMFDTDKYEKRYKESFDYTILINTCPDMFSREETELEHVYKLGNTIVKSEPKILSHSLSPNYFNLNRSINDVDWGNITHLTFGHCFNKPVDSVNWGNITHLTFGDCFNQSVDSVNWGNIAHLTFGYFFNKQVNSVDWGNITHLTFSYFFNQSVDSVNWCNITHLTFGNCFNQSVDSVN